jgi:hypothetical protein
MVTPPMRANRREGTLPVGEGPFLPSPTVASAAVLGEVAEQTT